MTAKAVSAITMQTITVQAITVWAGFEEDSRTSLGLYARTA